MTFKEILKIKTGNLVKLFITDTFGTHFLRVIYHQQQNVCLPFSSDTVINYCPPTQLYTWIGDAWKIYKELYEKQRFLLWKIFWCLIRFNDSLRRRHLKYVGGLRKIQFFSIFVYLKFTLLLLCIDLMIFVDISPTSS